MDLKSSHRIFNYTDVDLDHRPTNMKKPNNVGDKGEVPHVSRKLNFSAVEGNSFSQRYERPLINVLSEYEDVNNGLQALFEHYQAERISLKDECLSLTKENENLTNELKKCMEGEMRKFDSCAEAHLKQQLSIATQEKEAVLDLWRLAVSEVTNLEKVIKILQEQKDTSFNSSFDARGDSTRRLIAAEEALAEARLALAGERGARSAAEEASGREKEARATLEAQLAVAVGAAHTLEGKVAALEREKERMQRSLDTLQPQLKEMRMQADESQSKVADALALVDTACLNRDQTNLELAQSKEEVARLEAALRALKEEAQTQVKREVEQVKQQCNLHVRGILADVRRCQEEGTELKNKADKAIYSQKQAENLVEQKAQELKSVRNKESSLEPRLQAVQAKLADYEQRCAVAEEKARILQQNYNDEHQRWTTSELRVTETCKQLEKQVTSLALELESCKNREAGLAQQLSLREQQSTWRVSELEKSSRASLHELNRIVLAHQAISEKSKTELRQMAEKFSARLKELRSEVVRLRQERDNALQQLHSSKMNRSVQITPRPKSLFMDV